MQTFTELIDCYFNANTDVGNEKSKKQNKDNVDVYTAEDLLNQLKKNSKTKMDMETDEELQCSGNFKTYGLWTEVEGMLWQINMRFIKK